MDLAQSIAEMNAGASKPGSFDDMKNSQRRYTVRRRGQLGRRRVGYAAGWATCEAGVRLGTRY
jgi:hypothetical protein